MATYTWKCKKCAELVDIERRMADYQIPPHDACACGHTEYERFIAPAHFKLLGDGWHKDEYTPHGPDYNKQKQAHARKR